MKKKNQTMKFVMEIAVAKLHFQSGLIARRGLGLFFAIFL